MIRLIIDTALGYTGFGVAMDHELLGSIIIKQPSTFTKLSIDIISSLLRSVQLDKSSIQEITVSAGPGTFTGLRTGISLAKGVCMALGIPIIPVMTLDAMANTLKEVHMHIVCAIDGKNESIYVAEYVREDSTIKRITEAAAVRVGANAFQKGYPVELVSANVERYRQIFQLSYPAGIQWHELDVNRMIQAINFIAHNRLYNVNPVEAASYTPIYLRQPDVK
ncbi:MAG: tRNA (adenosine(37)-N6)-threonylcarbamoyltransferase complex dimerization subunit type 1 TsaB [Deltaproteobacteria bacterium]|nr:tRNA (adenosine(37)-N6)-threonylcarbamoyltransferase complex dimerization subunit type 1 TsaB [Deltaproteobacteria bacterium]